MMLLMYIFLSRLIVQTSNPYHKKYRGTFHCLWMLVREEGIGALYWNRRLYSNILYYTLDSLFRHTSPFIIERYLGLSSEYDPILFQVASFFLDLLHLGVTLPLDTVRRRLECQVLRRTPDVGVTGEERGFEPMVR